MFVSNKIRDVLNAPKSNGFWLNAFLRFKSNHLAVYCFIFIFILGSFCAIVPMVSHYDYSVPDFSHSLTSPNLTHLFGSDGLGRDLFVRCFIGGRITFDSVAGFLGGKIDVIMMRLVDVLYGVPFLFFSILLLTLFGQSLILSFVAIAAISWLDMARVVRGQTLSLRHKEFVEAAQICGVSSWHIITRHIIPNLIGVVIVYAALVVPNMIVLSAVLSFFGLGVMEPMTSWGLLINDGAQNMNSWWLLLFPALLMISTLLAFAFVANGLRDALDPR